MWTQQHCLGHRPTADTCRTRKVSVPFRGLSWLLGSLQPGASYQLHPLLLLLSQDGISSELEGLLSRVGLNLPVPAKDRAWREEDRWLQGGAPLPPSPRSLMVKMPGCLDRGKTNPRGCGPQGSLLWQVGESCE